MRIAEFEVVTPCLTTLALPCRIEQRVPRAANVMTLVALTPLSLLVLAGVALLGAMIWETADPVALILSNPGSTAQIAIAIGLATVLAIWPLQRAISRIGRSRQIDIDGDMVVVTDTHPFGKRTWRQPLSGYSGVAHHVRTTLAGLRHELILVHPDRRSSLLLAVADRITTADIARIHDLLGTGDVSPGLLYGGLKSHHGAIEAREPRRTTAVADLASAARCPDTIGVADPPLQAAA